MSIKEPSYHDVNYALRPAKNIERKMMSEVLQCLARVGPVSEYQYVGFGSIFFADYRLFHRTFGMDRMTSIEGYEDDEARVKHNRPYDCIEVKMGMSYDVLRFLDWSRKSIVWLDYDHEIARYVLDDLDLVSSRVQPGSVIVVTLDGETKRLKDPKTVREEELETWPKRPRQQLERLVGKNRVSPELQPHDLRGKRLMETYRRLLTAQIDYTLRSKNLGADEADRWHFRQIFNFRYADTAQMMTVGWVLYPSTDSTLIEHCRFGASEFCRDSDRPLEIKVPNLTLREIRDLDRYLPTGTDSEGYRQIPVPDHDKRLYHKIYRLFPTFTEADL